MKVPWNWFHESSSLIRSFFPEGQRTEFDVRKNGGSLLAKITSRYIFIIQTKNFSRMEISWLISIKGYFIDITVEYAMGHSSLNDFCNSTCFVWKQVAYIFLTLPNLSHFRRQVKWNNIGWKFYRDLWIHISLLLAGTLIFHIGICEPFAFTKLYVLEHRRLQSGGSTTGSCCPFYYKFNFRVKISLFVLRFSVSFILIFNCRTI